MHILLQNCITKKVNHNFQYFLKKQVFDLNCIVYSNATVHFPLRHISFDSKTRLKILYIMDFQKKKEGGPYTTTFLTYCQTFLLFPHRSRCSSSIWETTLFSLFFSYLLLCQSQGHSILFLQYFDASSLSHGANKRKAALNAHILPIFCGP